MGKEMKLLKIAVAFSVMVLAAACSGPYDRVVVAFLDADQDIDQHRMQVAEAGGAFAAPLLRNQGALSNAALPASTTDLNAGLVSITHFANENDERDFISRLEPDPDVSFLAVGRTANWFPFIGSPQPLSALKTVDEPGFVLVNLIAQRPMANPRNATRMMRYMMSATPTLKGNDVVFASPIFVDHVIGEDHQADLLFLTIWPDQATFDAIHNDRNFVGLARNTRNQVFESFTENAALPVGTNSD
jgi:hypothetical protein